MPTAKKAAAAPDVATPAKKKKRALSTKELAARIVRDSAALDKRAAAVKPKAKPATSKP